MTLSRCGRADYRSISNNSLSGTLPDELGGGQLFHLSLQHNQFSGTIPSTLAHNTELAWLCVFSALSPHRPAVQLTTAERECADG